MSNLPDLNALSSVWRTPVLWTVVYTVLAFGLFLALDMAFSRERRPLKPCRPLKI